jgi:hypothetical protein
VTSASSQNGTPATIDQPRLNQLLTVKDLVFFGIGVSKGDGNGSVENVSLIAKQRDRQHS